MLSSTIFRENPTHPRLLERPYLIPGVVTESLESGLQNFGNFRLGSETDLEFETRFRDLGLHLRCHGRTKKSGISVMQSGTLCSGPLPR